MLKIIGKNIHQSYFVVFLCVGIIAGAILALVFRINYFASGVWILFALLLLGFAFWKPKLAFVVIALVAGMILMFFRASAELYGEDYIRQFYGQEVVVSGVVDGDPNSDEKGTKVKLKDLKFGEEEVEARGSIYLTLKYSSEVARADEMTVAGKLLEGFGTYAGYMYKPEVRELKRANPGDWVLGVRNWCAERVKSLIPEEEANLGLSYLLGMKSGLSDDLTENLRVVGLVHIVVASGAHLSILVEIARRIFGRLSRFTGLLLSVVFVVFFMGVVGWTPSIMRAGVMAILTILAWYVGRKFAAWRIILIVAAGTLVANPMYIINLGWLLSFAAFGGIMILGPRLAKFFYGDREPKFVASVVLTTVAATVMTLPITLYYFGTVSLLSVVANLLILPTLPWAMGLVFLTGVCAGVPVIETAVAWCATKLLDFHIAVVEFFGAEKEFLVEIEPYQGWVWGIYVPILAFLGFGFWRKFRKKKKVV